MSEVTNSITASAVLGGAAPGEAELLLPQLLGRHQRQLAARGRKKKEKKKREMLCQQGRWPNKRLSNPDGRRVG